jgi:hypothetical protein
MLLLYLLPTGPHLSLVVWFLQLSAWQEVKMDMTRFGLQHHCSSGLWTQQDHFNEMCVVNIASSREPF